MIGPGDYSVTDRHLQFFVEYYTYPDDVTQTGNRLMFSHVHFHRLKSLGFLIFAF